MAAATYSAGPWHYCGGPNKNDKPCQCGFVWAADGDVHVASAHSVEDLGQDWYGSDCACSREVQAANVRLITAAPEMYEAISALLNSTDYADDNRPLMEAVRAATAKARQR